MANEVAIILPKRHLAIVRPGLLTGCATRGVPDVVEHGKTGLLAPSGDERSLAGLVRELLLDREKLSRMSAAAVSYAAGERNIESAAVLLRNLLARFAVAA